MLTNLARFIRFGICAGASVAVLAAASVVVRPAWQDARAMAHARSVHASTGVELRGLVAPVSNFALLDILAKMMSFVQVGVSSVFGKQEAALSQLLQGQLNYGSILRTQDRAAIARNVYAGISQGSCDALQGGVYAGEATAETHLMAKGLTAARVAATADVANASTIVQARMTDINNSYCSNYAASIGRCTKNSNNQQDADVNLGSLLVPSSTDTLSNLEVKAASAYIDNVTVPISVEALPVGMDRTPQGAAMLHAQRQMQARLAMSQHSLSSMLAARQPR